MRQLLRDLRHGRDLRHMPVALEAGDRSAVAALAERRDGSRRSVMHVPVSLSPFIMGTADEGDTPDDAVSIVFTDASSDRRNVDRAEARIRVRSIGNLELAGTALRLFRPHGASNAFEALPRRYWKYALAWRKASRERHGTGGLKMDASDLRALDCYYVWPRPVYLVGVRHENDSNLFPMDLVGPMGDGAFCLALRTTSPSVRTMIDSGRAVLSTTPGTWKDRAYALGAHHRRLSIDPAALPFSLRSSRHFGLPVPEGVPGYMEIELLESTPIGSHTFFVGRIAHQETVDDTPTPQLGHVSALYAAWRARRGEPFREA